MALSRTTYGVVATPRVYVDNLLLARTLGLKFNIGSIYYGMPDDDHVVYSDSSTAKALWDLDPVRSLRFQNQTDDITFIQNEFYTSDDDRPYLGAFFNLMHTSNYAAVLNHNLFSGGDESTQVNLDYNGTTLIESTTSIVGNFNEDIDEDGFIIAEFELNDENIELDQFDFKIVPSSATDLGSFDYNIGSFSVGTYLDFPVSPDLSVKVGYTHDGVQSKRTIGGKDLTHVSYSGSPDWGRLPPFSTSKGIDTYYRGTGFTGRKSWDMKFSYVDKTDMFNAVQSGSSAGGYFRSLLSEDGTFDVGFKQDNSILGVYLNRTLGGSLRHVLQPDNTKAEFYMVKLDQRSTKITSVAHGVFEVSFKFVQVW